MKKLVCLFVCLFSLTAFADVYVRPYVRSDGTAVEGHMRTNPNSTKTDNYSYPGNGR